MVAVSDYHPQGTDELLSHQGDLIQVFYKNKAGPEFTQLQNRQKRVIRNPIKCSETHSEISKQQSFSYGKNQPDINSLQPQASSGGSHHNIKWIAVNEPAIKNGVAEEHAKFSWRNAEDDTALTHGAEVCLPLTGSTLHGTPGFLRKIWMKHKKKAEYLGATNGAFEAD
ncbi:vexin isoform X2 [Eublepharis macularius]|nr:vexin isoform X2 [Eublepharis macularius]